MTTQINENSSIFFNKDKIDETIEKFQDNINYYSITNKNETIEDMIVSLSDTDIIHEKIHQDAPIESVTEFNLFFYHKETKNLIRSIDQDFNVDIHSSFYEQIKRNISTQSDPRLVVVDDNNYIIETYFLYSVLLNETQKISMAIVGRSFNRLLYDQFRYKDTNTNTKHVFLNKEILDENEVLISKAKNPYTEMFQDSF
jgi:hypothetical protein